ncbi:MAG: response regulator transcription factor [Chloroflexi bacterium]|nr:response regulator transcription factor [Chloroflexota bacterium]
MNTKTSHKILVVDDERSITDLLEYNLERNGYHVVIARDGHQALRLAEAEQPDLVILDLMLPGLDGLDVCRVLRRESAIPIIMLTARDEEVERVVGLELGADDYVTKPFSVRELIARVKAVLRRTAHIAPTETSAGTVYRNGLLQVDTLSHEARIADILLPLTRLEFDLLETLIRHAGQALSRDQLLDQVWGYDYYGDARAVDSAVKRLRAKLRAAGGDPTIISNVRGVGYRMERPQPLA